MEPDDDQEARTIFCANLVPEKITEELLYELFIQGGPIERVSLPKDKDGKNRAFGFITYRHVASVPYALSVFAGTRLFNREIRLNNRNSNGNNNSKNNSFNDSMNRSQQMPMEPQPLMPNIPPMHQFQMQSPYGNSALRGNNALMNPFASPAVNNMMPRQMAQLPDLPNQEFDFQSLLAFSAQMLQNANDLASNGNGNETHKHQSKMMHRQDNRTHNQNKNYSRNDRDRSGGGGKNGKNRDREIEDELRRTDNWIRGRAGGDRRDRDRDGDRKRNGGSRRRDRR